MILLEVKHEAGVLKNKLLFCLGFFKKWVDFSFDTWRQLLNKPENQITIIY